MTVATAEIAIHLNGEPVVTGSRDLAAFVAGRQYGSARIATALNGRFVPERLRADTPIMDGDRIEIVSARQGG